MIGDFLPLRLDIVWNEEKQTWLIDSLFHNYYIPPIIFGMIQRSLVIQLLTTQCPAVTTKPNGGEKRRCIDGKQRLTSIHRCEIQFAVSPPTTKIRIRAGF